MAVPQVERVGSPVHQPVLREVDVRVDQPWNIHLPSPAHRIGVVGNGRAGLVPRRPIRPSRITTRRSARERRPWPSTRVAPDERHWRGAASGVGERGGDCDLPALARADEDPLAHTGGRCARVHHAVTIHAVATPASRARCEVGRDSVRATPRDPGREGVVALAQPSGPTPASAGVWEVGERYAAGCGRDRRDVAAERVERCRLDRQQGGGRAAACDEPW